MRSQVVRAGSFKGIVALARYETALKAAVRVVGVRHRRGAVELELEGRLRRLRFEPAGEQLRWHAPGIVRKLVDPDQLDARRSVDRTHLHLVLRSAADGTEHVLPHTAQLRLQAGERGLVTPIVAARATVDPATAAAGAPLAPGEWQLVVQVRAGAFNDTALTVVHGDGGRAAPLTFVVGADGRLDRGPWMRRHLAGRVPRPVLRFVRRAAAGARSTARR